MARVIIPSPLRRYTNYRREIKIEASDLSTLMESLLASYQGLSIIREQPALLSIFINGRLVKADEQSWNEIGLKEDDEISLIIPIAGG